MKLFHDQIFMGAGESSGSDCYDLVCQLQTALSILSGLQQPIMSTMKVDEKEYKEETKEMEMDLFWHTQSIVKALLGKHAKVVTEDDPS